METQITNGQELSLRRRSTAVLRAMFFDGNFTAQAGGWKIFFNNKHGVHAETNKPWPRQIRETRNDKFWLIIGQEASYQEILNALKSIVDQLRIRAEETEKHMQKLKKHFDKLANDVGTDDRRLDFCSAEYALPK